ncbi:DUF2804 domain-containing protein [Shewanella sp. C32]|uniref:DUF2804 domain-containing protein n=1 Tax=Shewanella electrica TaxID=515560 RepID=A0ABT2FFN2_9GAMM|nr:DUF2804 family protein [Shewanella electrica]MCH1925270.1 DUF2804 domain-containing protein [Shewanella electrica]MCS4555095.1 DUF2804 domain-containing protein [Shewanella electrica]
MTTDEAVMEYCAVVTRRAPSALLRSDQQPIYGYFDGAVPSLAAVAASKNSALPTPLSTLSRPQHRQLEMVMLQHADYQLLLRQSSQTLASQVLVFDLVRQQARRIMPNPLALRAHQLSPSGYHGESQCGVMNFVKSQGDWHIMLNMQRQKLQLTGQVALQPLPLSLPVVSCGAVSAGWSYQQQHHGLMTSGDLQLNHEAQILSRMSAGYSFFATAQRDRTPWQWLMLNSTQQQQRIGLTLVDGLAAAFPGNALWIDGARHILPYCQMVPSSHIAGEWQIISATEQVRGRFSPKIEISVQRPVGKQRTKVMSGLLDIDIYVNSTLQLNLRGISAIGGVEC